MLSIVIILVWGGIALITLYTNSKYIFSILGIGSLILIILSCMILKYNFNEIKRFNDHITFRTGDNLQSLAMPGIYELNNIVQAINHLIMKINAGHQQKRLFVEGVTHELTEIVVVFQEFAKETISELVKLKSFDKEKYKTVSKLVTRLENIVEQLLLMTNKDEVGSINIIEKINVKSITDQICIKYQQLANAKRISIDCYLAEDFSMFSNKKYLTIILDNLINNALEYSVNDCNIAINSVLSAGKIELTVTNKVIDLSNEDVPNLFEPFWKKVQLHDINHYHNGLGLAVVKVLVGRLGLSITAELINNKYLMATISWPLN